MPQTNHSARLEAMAVCPDDADVQRAVELVKEL